MSKLAVIYARFSSDKQREESIEGQIRECTAFADANDIKIVGTYIDRAMSARTDKRPDFLRMIADSVKGVFEYVLVYQLDRFSRNRYDSAVYKNKLKKNGVRVLSAKENIRDDPSGIILESVIEGYAEYYSAELSQKVTRGMTDNLLEKKWTGGLVPLGYRTKKDGTLAIDPAGAAAVTSSYKQFIAGKTVPQIIDYLNEHNYRTTMGTRFNRNSLSRVLRNKIYTGTFSWGGTEYPEFAPRIISDATYQAAQAIFNARKKKSGQEVVWRRRPDAYALTGKIYCGVCGMAMTGMAGRSRSGEMYHYYRCSSKNNSKEKARREKIICSSRSVNRDKLESLILDTTVQILSSPEALHCIAEQAVKAQENAPQAAEVKRLEVLIGDIEKRLQNSIRAVESGIISDTIARNIRQYEDELAGLKTQLEMAKLDTGFKITAEAVEYFLKEMVKKNDRYKLDTFQAFIRRIVITGDKVEIYYNYHSVPNILKNPVNKMLTGCSSSIAMVTR